MDLRRYKDYKNIIWPIYEWYHYSNIKIIRQSCNHIVKMISLEWPNRQYTCINQRIFKEIYKETYKADMTALMVKAALNFKDYSLNPIKGRNLLIWYFYHAILSNVTCYGHCSFYHQLEIIEKVKTITILFPLANWNLIAIPER